MRFENILFLLALLGTFQAKAQEQLGLRLENYAGINSIFLNPSGHTTTPFNWDVNLVEFNQFVENNYVYLLNSSVSSLIRDADQIDDAIIASEIDPENPPGEDVLLIDFFDNSRKRFVNLTTSITGPSFYVSLNDQHTVGLFTRFRVMAGTRNLPNNFSYYTYEDIPLQEGFTVDKFQAAALSWSEIGVNYLNTREAGDGVLGIGISAKYLQGYEGAFIQNTSDFELEKGRDNLFTASPTTLKAGYTTTIPDAEAAGVDYEPQRNGAGFGVDLGITYAYYEDEGHYKWKAGASILDIGAIRFNQSARLHEISTSDVATLDGDDYNQFQGVDELDEAIELASEQLLGDPFGSLQGEAFSMWLPTALSLQFDYGFNRMIYVNTTFVEDIPVSNARVRRGGLLAVTPRVEHRWFSASLPVSVYNYQDFRVGLAMRLGFITLGSDNLGSLVGQSDLTGTDFYFAVKINPFQLNKEKKNKNGKGNTFDRGSKRTRFGGGGRVRCPKF